MANDLPAFGAAYDGAKQEIRSDVVLAQRVARLDLPVRLVTDSAIAESETAGPEGGQVLVDRTSDLIKSYLVRQRLRLSLPYLAIHCLA